MKKNQFIVSDLACPECGMVFPIPRKKSRKRESNHIINIEITGRIPSNKQAKVVLKARERMVNEGMPLQF